MSNGVAVVCVLFSPLLILGSQGCASLITSEEYVFEVEDARDIV